MDSKSITRVLFAAGGVMAGLILSQMLGAASWSSKIGIGNSAAA